MLVTAARIHDGIQWLPQGTIIETSDDGTIVALHNRPLPGVVVYDGVLCPGFVNAHCHLELSHMKGVIPEHTGLIPFLQTIPRHRNDHTEEEKRHARHQALRDMAANGIVAVGDISNVADTLDLRSEDLLHFYTFVEAIGFSDANAQISFDRSLSVYETYAAQTQGKKILKQDIAPHAPYSVSASLFRLIGHHGNSVISLHNQESKAEDEYFRHKQGDVRDLLHGFGIDDSAFAAPGVSSLQAYLQWLPHNRPLLLVHNTYTTEEELQLAQGLVPELYLCLCPGANLYIENKLPDIAMLIRNNATLCIGTDSLASNHTLNVWQELCILKEHYPQLEWETLLQWGTHNGARALQMDNEIGRIAIGKRPGIVHIDDLGSPNINVIEQ